VLLERRPGDGLLGGMWAFPEREVGEDVGDTAAAERAALALATALGARPLARAERLAAYTHRFTHIHATYVPYVMSVDGAGVHGDDLAWVEPGAPTELALPVVQRRILEDLAVEARAVLSDGW
jgi:adenine-specific DNA glycosylase